MYAENYEIEEYPNINCLKGAPDFPCIFGLFTSFFDGTHFYNMDNNKIRTEWRINCNYPGPDGFYCNFTTSTLNNFQNKIPIGPAETSFEKEIFPFTFQK